MKRRLLIILFLLLLCGSYGWTMKGMDDHIAITLTTDKTVYRLSEPILMSLAVLNQAGESLDMTFPSSKIYDFILSNGKATVWQWSEGRIFTQSLHKISLPAGKSLVYKAVFNPAAAKKILDEGRYKLVGIWPALNRTFVSDPVYIDIRK